ncbi:calcyclin-binding protein [Rhagoletis pomonella]|uniref:calcyclin-binding protein n=1 Tax=Rhagoletis pomonella TaxID=28610 RepID=UPI0017821F0F|nr:calcyclin-binding protein [Rhagoletis pomonella]
MSMQELVQDVEEVTKLLGEVTRPRIRNVLLTAKAEIEKEIVNLEMKEHFASQKKASGEDAKPKRYLVELTEYAWDQSDKFVKLFVTLDGVQNIDKANVGVTFNENSMVLHVSDLNGKDYGLTINNLLEGINIEKSYCKVKTDMVAIYMKKNNEGKCWDHLTRIQKRLKEKVDAEFKNSDDTSPENALVNIMKKMYNSGDSKTKQMIAKAWTEGQQKAHLREEM